MKSPRTSRFLATSIAALLPVVTWLVFTPGAQAANVTRTLTTSGSSNLVAAPTAAFTGGSPSAASVGDIFLYNTATTAANLNLDGSITIGAIKTSNTGTLSILAGGGTITLDGTGISGANATNGVAGTAGIQASAAGSNVNIAAPIVLATNTDFAATAAFSAVTATPNISVTGAITASAATTLSLRATNSNGNITISGNIGQSGAGTIAITNTSSGGGIVVLSGNLGSQVSSVTAAQTNQFTPLYLTGTNSSFSGGTSITTTSGNIFAINPTASGAGAGVITALGTGTVALGGGTLNLRANGTAANSTIITGDGTTGNNVTVSGNTTINVDRVSAITGVPGTAGTTTGSTIQLNNLSIGASTLTVSAGNAYGLQFAGTTTLTGNATFNVASTPFTLSGSISGTGFGITKNNIGTMTLTAANTYTGATNVTDVSAFNTFNANGVPLVVSGTTGAINSTSAVNITGDGIFNSPGGSAFLQLDNTAGSLERINDSAIVNLSRGGEFRLTQGNSTTGATETVSALNFAGGLGVITLNGAASVLTQLKATDLTRASLGTGLVRGTTLGNGNTNVGRIILTNVPTGANFVGTSPTLANTTTGTGTDKTLKIVPWLIGDTATNGGNFGSALVTYDTTSGLRPLANGEQSFLAVGNNAYATAGENVALNTAPVTLTTTGPSVFNSLFIAGANSPSLNGSGGSLTINSGTIGGNGQTGGSIGGFSVINLDNSEGVILGDVHLALNSPVNVTQGGAASAGGLTKAGRVTVSLNATNLYIGQTTVNLGLLQLGTGSTTGALANGSQAIVLNGGSFGTNRSDAVTLANPISGFGGFTKNGIGTTTLTNNNTFIGNLVANNGTLVLDASTAAGNPVNYSVGTGTLAFLNGGTLQFNGKAGATTTQAIGNISTGSPSNNGGATNSGLSTIAVNNNGGTTTTVNAGTLGRSINTAILVDESSGGLLTTTTNTTNGLLAGANGAGGSILVKDSTSRIDFASKTANGVNPIIALNAATALPTTAGTITTNYALTGSQTQGGATLANSIRINSVSGTPKALDLGTNTLLVDGGAILYVGSDAYSITGSGASSFSSVASNGTAILENFGTGSLTVTTKLGTGNGVANFVGNGSSLIDWNSTSNLTPTTATNGTTTVSNATLRLSNSGAVSLTNTGAQGIGTGLIYVANGGILELASGNLSRDIGTTANGQLAFTGGGGFSAFGADRTVTFGNAATLTWGRTAGPITAGFLEDGQSLILGSATSTNKLTLTNALNLGTATHLVEVRDGTSSTNVDGVLSGILSGAGGALTKTGAGTLQLSAANTYTGPTTVTAGTLLVSGSISGSTVLVRTGATLSGGTTATPGVTGAVTVESGGTISPGDTLGAPSTGTLNTGALSLQAASTFRLEIDTTAVSTDLAASSGALTLSLANDVVLSLADLGGNVALAPGTLKFITYNGTWNGGLFTVGGNVIADDTSFIFGSNTFTLDYNLDGNSVALVVVPEPGVAASLLGGFTVLLGLTRRRRRA